MIYEYISKYISSHHQFSPGLIDVINIGSGDAVEEDEKANDARNDKHLVVEAKPSKVEPHLVKERVKSSSTCCRNLSVAISI